MKFSIEERTGRLFKHISVQEDGPHDVLITASWGEHDKDGDDVDCVEVLLSPDDAKLLAMAIMRVAERAEAKK